MVSVHLTRGRRFGRARAHFVGPAEEDISWDDGQYGIYWNHGPTTMTDVC